MSNTTQAHELGALIAQLTVAAQNLEAVAGKCINADNAPELIVAIARCQASRQRLIYCALDMARDKDVQRIAE